ncbi:MAG: 4Fe-4S dicluster domain-containing protein [Fibrobacteria bacterium]|nr:4Fe-4S dicluster domain-containing protein [Fibrobacteria bacterium]
MIGILTDVTKCIGCHKCVGACVDANKLDKHIPAPQHTSDGLAANRWTSIIKQPDSHYVRKQCRHCLEPACVSACIVGALKKTKSGPVVYDKKKCIGCRYCMMACPYGVPKYEWDTPVPYVRKCTMCYERVSVGKQPACTEACPTGATVFGDRDKLIAEAKLRITKNPEKYINRVFGEVEVGGTSVLYLSDIPLGFLGWKDDLGKEALPKLTWSALSKVPTEFLGMGAAMTGAFWIIGRRNKMRAMKVKEEAEKKAVENETGDAGTEEKGEDSNE